MRFERKPSFTRQYKKLDSHLQNEVFQAIQKLFQIFGTGERILGLGLKQLHKPFWEIRVGLHLRIVFRLEKDLIEFVLVGNHDEVKRFLKTN